MTRPRSSLLQHGVMHRISKLSATGRGAVLVVSLGLLGACDGGSDESAATSDTAPSTVAVTTTDAPASTTPTSDATTTPTDPASSCLEGDWQISEAELNAYYDELEPTSGFDPIDATGTILVSFTPTTYRYEESYELALTAGENVFTVVTSGAIDGTWTADDTTITSEITSNTRDAEFSEDGTPLDDPGDLGVGIFQRDPLADVPYSCDGPTLMIAVDEFATTRHPVRLTPA